MLLQFVLCKADTGIVTFTYVEGQEAPWPDFHLKRQCGNLEPLLDWAKGREVGAWQTAPRPKDAYLWPNPFVGDPDYELGYPLGHHHQGEGNPHPNLSSG